VGGPIVVSDVQTAGDLVRLRVRLRPPPAAPVASP